MIVPLASFFSEIPFVLDIPLRFYNGKSSHLSSGFIFQVFLTSLLCSGFFFNLIQFSHVSEMPQNFSCSGRTLSFSFVVLLWRLTLSLLISSLHFYFLMALSDRLFYYYYICFFIVYEPYLNVNFLRAGTLPVLFTSAVLVLKTMPGTQKVLNTYLLPKCMTGWITKLREKHMCSWFRPGFLACFLCCCLLYTDKDHSFSLLLAPMW